MNKLIWISLIALIGVGVYLIYDISNSLSGDLYEFNQDFLDKINKGDITLSNQSELNNIPLHWNHMPLTYSYTSSCPERLINKIELSFDIIENDTNGVVSFNQVDEGGDIYFTCMKEKPRSIDGITQGETAVMGQNNNISSATITFYGVDENKIPADCYNFPNVEIHEILHALGLGHDEDNPYSVMYPFNMGCVTKDREVTILKTGETFIPKDEIDTKIISCLVSLYSGNQELNCSNVSFLSFE